MKLIRDTLCEIVSLECPGNSVAVLLSGGVDSLTCGFAAEDAGKKVTAYTFQVGEWQSADSLAAKRCASLFDWDFNLIKVPLDNLEDDFLRLAEKYQCRKKTQYECTWPFLYMFPEIQEQDVISGVAADGHYGLSRKACEAVHGKHNRHRQQEVFNEFRKAYFDSDNPAGVRQLEILAREYDKRFSAPYLDPQIFEIFINMSWDSINRPRQKYPILNAYKDRFKVCGTRTHLVLQLAAGIDLIFNKLLKSKLNTKSRTRVMDLCRDYAKPIPE